MKIASLAALASLATACAPPRAATCSAPAADAGAVAAIEAGNAQFATDLYAQLAEGADGGNFFYSPFSVTAALAMTYAGANGGTAAQMAQTLHLTPAAADVPAALAQIDCQVRTDGQAAGNQLSVANGLFGQKGMTFEAPFLNVLQADYGAPLQTLDFAGNPGGASQAIDGWVSDQTAGKIPELLQPGDVGQDARLVLANALYFKGSWAQKFDPAQTQPGPFTTSAGTQVQVPLMAQDVTAGYFKGSGFALLELPYAGKQLALDVVLPDAADGLPQLAESFTAEAFGGWVGQLAQQDVAVTLPRFSLDSRFSLGATLSAMGMPLAFGPEADFSGMDGAHDLYLGFVIHEATVDVDETGTTAAAATAVGMKRAAAVLPFATFDANHPFLFVLRDLPTGTLLFVGQLGNPA